MRTQAILLTTICLALVLPANAAPTTEESAAVSDGLSPVATGFGTTIIPPAGLPARVVNEDESQATSVPLAASWGPLDIGTLIEAVQPPSSASSLAGCTRYRAGWYETDSSSIYGGYVAITPQNMPPNPVHYCSGSGMGYTDGVSFSASSWIQAGLAIFPGEVGARWFCQVNDNGATSTYYGPANAYLNGQTVATWFSRDSGGVWRTYRYDTGPWSVALPCTITRGASGNLQTFGEIQAASSTSAPMGPWKMFDVRYQATSGSWYNPTQMQAYYPGGTPCPPYGAGTISGGAFTAGSGAACTTGTKPYPN